MARKLKKQAQVGIPSNTGYGKELLKELKIEYKILMAKGTILLLHPQTAREWKTKLRPKQLDIQEKGHRYNKTQGMQS